MDIFFSEDLELLRLAKEFMRSFFFWLLCAALLSWCIFSLVGGDWSPSEGQTQLTQITFCDVGQGDAALIQQGQLQILIDVGPDAARLLECLTQIPRNDRVIELVILTHPDNDHIGAIEALTERFMITQLMMNVDAKNTADFKAFQQLVLRQKERGVMVVHPWSGQVYSLGDGINLEILSPLEPVGLENPFRGELTETTLSDVLAEHTGAIKDYNDRSISLFLGVGEVAFFFTGDIGKHTEQALKKNLLLKDIDVLKVAHHGSKTSTTDLFLEVVRPEISVISAGKDNRYGHPDPEVVTRLERSGSRVLRTDILGGVKVETDGKTYWTGKKEEMSQ